MAHLVESMAYVGTTPWHGLGHPLTPNQSIEVWAQQAGMDWRIESSDVSYMAQNQRGQNIIMPFEEQRVLYRSDTHAPLSVVSQRYQEVQPKQILEFYRDLTEQSGFELETAGVLKGGKKFWALARTGQSFALKSKDVSNGYILLATAWMAKVQGLIWVAFGFRLSLEEVCLGYASMRKACSSPRCLSPAPAPNHVESSRWS